MPARRELLTLPIGDDLWSLGYDWLVAGSNTSLTAQASAEAATTGADAIVYRRDGTEHQYGLGHLAPDDRANGMAAAAAFASYLSLVKRSTSGIGLFSLSADQWWLIEVDDATIDPDSDCVYVGQADAEAAFSARLKTRYWNNLFVPQPLIDQANERVAAGVQDTVDYDRILTRVETSKSLAPDTTPLEAVLTGRTAERYSTRGVRKAESAVRQFARNPILLGLVGISVLALILIYGVLPLMKRWTAKPIHVAQTLPPPPPPPPPPITSPLPSIFEEPIPQRLMECMNEMASIADHTPAGWVAGKLDCTKTGTIGEIHRISGQLDELDKSWNGAAVVPDLQTYSTVQVAVPRTAQPVSRSETPAQHETLRRTLISLGWRLGERMSVDPFVAPARDAARDKATWLQAPFTITSEVSPPHWAAILAQYPGLVLTEVQVDAAKLGNQESPAEWIIKGIIYAQ